MGLRKHYYKDSGGDGIPAELFQILKDDVVKVLHSICQKIWKAQQWSQDWKGSVFISVSKRAMPKNVQTTVQLCSFHVLARRCSKSFKLGFNSMWPKNLQMYKLVLEKAEESDIKLPTLLHHRKSKRISGKDLLLHHWLKPLIVWITTNWKMLKEMGISKHLICLLRNLYAVQEATEQCTGSNFRKEYVKHIVTLLI